jgi:hypothetical protein
MRGPGTGFHGWGGGSGVVRAHAPTWRGARVVRAPCARLARWTGGPRAPCTRLARLVGPSTALVLRVSQAAGACPPVPANPGWAPAGCGRLGGGGVSSMRRMGSVAWGGGAPPVGAAGQLPTPLMDRPMMSPTHQGQILKVGGAAIGPVDQMMALTPGQGPLAVGDHTAAVADGQGAALGRGDDPAGAPHVQGLAGGAAQDRGQQDHGRLEPVGQVPWPPGSPSG